jgi:hypothetical protein
MTTRHTGTHFRFASRAAGGREEFKMVGAYETVTAGAPNQG